METVAELEGVYKDHGAGSNVVHALVDVRLRVREGEFVSVMGPSGSGKSTLLHLIAGLDDPSHGRIVVAGQVLRRLPEGQRSALRLRELGIVFQGFHLLPKLTVEGNVAWRLARLGLGRRRVRERTARALEQVEVPASTWQRYPGEISGGEQQRVATARALATEPRLLLADEPTGNLDSTTGHMILALLRRLSSERPMAIVLVTHDPYAAAYGDRIVQMRDGRLDDPSPACARNEVDLARRERATA
jgi:putative ABC transport system ATP-binding protein